MYILFMVTLLLGDRFQLLKPKPLSPGVMVHETGARYSREGLTIVMKPVGAESFLKRLEKKGIDKELLAREELRNYIHTLAIFDIQFENTGTDRLNFIPEQVSLKDRGSIVGFQLSMYDLLITPYGHSDPRVEKLAEMFIKTSVKLNPGDTKKHLVAFKPISMTKRFPKRVELTLDRLYYGITTRKVACQFQVRYKKK